MGIISTLSGENSYKYFDTPDGEDCLKKLWYVTKYSATYGVLLSSVDILLYSHPKGYLPILGRYAYMTFPFVGVGAAFVSTCCIAASIRKQDDKLNYFLGGYAAGAILGAWQRSIQVGFYSGLFLAIAAVVQKDAFERNWDLIGTVDKVPITGDFWTIKQDYSILKDPGKTWES